VRIIKFRNLDSVVEIAATRNVSDERRQARRLGIDSDSVGQHCERERRDREGLEKGFHDWIIPFPGPGIGVSTHPAIPLLLKFAVSATLEKVA